MAAFFLLMGLELKKEVMVGDLSTKSKLMAPAIAALGGVIVPALIFYFITKTEPQHFPGIAIPCATDIAFAYGIICLFGDKISKSAKVFLIALAVIDDLIAIVIIAIFYSHDIKVVSLVFSGLVMFLLWFLSKQKMNKILPYLLLGAALWLSFLRSGIHPSVAGVIVGAFIPLKIRNENFLENFAHKLSPLVNFAILPVFAFANAGVALQYLSLNAILESSLALGIIVGLFLGKQLGVFLFSFVAIRCGLVSLPRGVNWMQFYAIAMLTGIGFTMSLFIGALGFENDSFLFNYAKSAVLIGSALSAVFGSALLALSIRLKR
jgi:NhaA family Na+:H+ antiporter